MTNGITGRREFLGLGLAGVVWARSGLPAAALSPDDATAFVQATVDEVLALVKSGASTEEKAMKLRQILEARAALEQIAKFAAGRPGRDMTADQQSRYEDAFAGFLSRVYARRFQEYSGEEISVGRGSDAGKKGIYVKSEVSQRSGNPVVVDWLVTDRPGRIVIADIVIEGVSLVVTQREEIGAMLESRGGDFETLIADLAKN